VKYVNKRARTRLIGVTVVVLVAILAIVLLTGNKQAAVYSTVSSVSKDSSLVGKRVKVGGSVVAGSWNKQSNPMKFTIREESDTAGTGPTLKVVYTGAAPNTFGDGVVAIVTGTLGADGVVQANEMITKCPSKYESASGAIPVAELGAGQSMVGKTGLQTTGYVRPGSLSSDSTKRFVLSQKADGTGKTVTISYSGALADTVKDGTQVVVTGTLQSPEVFAATAVALEQGQQ
jgi:cytochrome c-type biogenesis protein CcmE